MNGVTTDRGQESRRSHLNGPTVTIRVPAAEGSQDILAGLTVQCGTDRGTGEGGRARREDTEQREKEKKLTMTSSVSRPRWPCRRRSEPC